MICVGEDLSISNIFQQRTRFSFGHTTGETSSQGSHACILENLENLTKSRIVLEKDCL